MKIKSFLFLAAVSLLCMSPESRAALLVYEGFDGYSVGTMIGQTVRGQGLTGTYSGSNFNYNATGLTFGSLGVSGGAVQSNTQQLTSLVSSVSIGTSVTGDLWMSYLFENSAIGGNVRTTISGDMRTASVLGGAGNLSGVSYSTTNYSTSSGSVLSTNTTYMMIAKWSNVGNALTTGSPGAARFWVLDLSQYESFVLSGYQESWLTAATVGTGASNVTGKLASPLYQTSGTFVFDDTRTLNLEVVNIWSAEKFDEIRIGTTLSSVAVPEPQVALLVVASTAMGLFLRKRNRQ